MAKYFVLTTLGGILDETVSFNDAYRIAEARAKAAEGSEYIIVKVKGTVKAERLPSPMMVSYREVK